MILCHAIRIYLSSEASYVSLRTLGKLFIPYRLYVYAHIFEICVHVT